MIGETVLATTKSNPPSTFEWYDSSRTGAFHTGHELTFESNMAGQVWMVVVKAVNTVGKGEQRSTSVMIRFRVRGMYDYVKCFHSQFLYNGFSICNAHQKFNNIRILINVCGYIVRGAICANMYLGNSCLRGHYLM